MPACGTVAAPRAARLLDGKVSANCALWIFTSRAVKSRAQEEGLRRNCPARALFYSLIPVQPSPSIAAWDPRSRRSIPRSRCNHRRHWNRGVGRIDKRLHQRGADRAGRRSADGPQDLRARTQGVCRPKAKRLVTRQTIPGWGGVNPVKESSPKRSTVARRSSKTRCWCSARKGRRFGRLCITPPDCRHRAEGTHLQ
jgi:hypothetical protein